MLNQQISPITGHQDSSGVRRLAGYRVDAERSRLIGKRGEIALEPRVMQTLIALLDQAGRTVRRETLVQQVWGHAHVTDDALNRCIALLRKALSDMPAPRPAIETVPRVGYQLNIPDSTPDGQRGRGPLPWLLAGAVVLASVLIVWIQRSPPALPEVPRIVPLTTLPGREVSVSFSPDSSQVVYAHRTDESPWRLLVQTLGSGAPRTLDTGPGQALAPRWSPDGRTIAFLRFDASECRVMTVAVSGGAARSLTPCHPRSDYSLAWTATSDGLIFTPPQTGARGLSRLDLDSGSITAITHPAAGEIGDSNPVVSADGRHLAFTRWHDYGVGDVYRSDINGDHLVRLTHDTLKIHGVAWDADHLIFASNRAGNFSLWRIPAAGGHPELMPITGREIDSPSVSPDGRWLVYEEWQDQSDIERLPLSGGLGETLVGSTRWDWGARQSGGRLAFVSDRSGAAEVWVSALDGAHPLQLTDNQGAYTQRPTWSHDGEHVVFEAPLEGQFDLYQVPASGGKVVRLTRHSASDRFPSFGPDGQLLFGSTRSGEWQIWSLAPGHPAPMQLTRDGGSVARWDPNREWLYVSHCEHGGLWRLAADLERRESVFPALSPIDCANWQLDGNGLFVVSRDPDSHAPSLARLDLASAEVNSLRDLPDFHYASGFQVEGDWLIYTRIRQRQADLMMIERLP